MVRIWSNFRNVLYLYLLDLCTVTKIYLRLSELELEYSFQIDFDLTFIRYFFFVDFGSTMLEFPTVAYLKDSLKLNLLRPNIYRF